jgi:hypothetical protein
MFWRQAPNLSRMVREATDSDIRALMPLLRGYCDFYKAKPSDEGLERMARAVIASPQAVYNRVGGRSAPFLEYELELS